MENIEIQTTQNVDIQYNIASVGDRTIATIIDSLIIFGYVILCILILSGFINERIQNHALALGITMFLPVFFYDFICEIFMNGQSLGKKAMKIRVVKLDGSQPGIGSYFLRWILRPIDISFTYGSVAIITMLINGKGQRLGDLAANTTVIKIKREVKLDEILIPKVTDDYCIKYHQASLLTEKDIQIIKEILNMRSTTDFKSYQKILYRAKQKFSEKMKVESNLDPLLFFDTILKDYNQLNNN